jgi:O-glycosyl hydrolase
MAMYESDHTKFMREYLEKHPEERESQKKGRAVWWDHAGDQRSAPDPVNHSPKAGGNEYLFQPLSEEEQEKK